MSVGGRLRSALGPLSVAWKLGFVVVLVGCNSNSGGEEPISVADGGCPYKHELAVGKASNQIGRIVLMPYGGIMVRLVSIDPPIPVQASLAYWQKTIGAPNDNAQVLLMTQGKLYTIKGKWGAIQVMPLTGESSGSIATFCSDRDWGG
jgi:hypothetical protein